MKGFVLGLLFAALLFGGYMVWKARNEAALPLARPTVDAGAGASKKKKRRVRGAARVARADRPAQDKASPGVMHERPVVPEPEPEPEPVKLSAADLKIVGQGDDLSRPDVLKLDMSDGKEGRELSQDDIDAKFRAQESNILDCISSARPDPESFVPGRVTVKFRIQRTGQVRGVRVEAPAVLMKGGLYSCIKGVVGRLQFPASDSSQVLTYPYSLS